MQEMFADLKRKPASKFMEIFSKLKNKKSWQFLGMIIIFSVFFLLRLYRLGYHDFWYDEAGTVFYAQHPWGNWNAPLYWILLHFWIKLFGISEFSMRFPSLIFSFLSVVLVFIMGRKLFNKRVGIIASIIMGLSPFHIWYAQEARDYSMLLFFGMLSSWLVYKAINEKRLKIWAFFILASIAGLYTNYFFIFILIAQLIYIVAVSRQLKLNFRSFIPFLIIGAGFLPYLRLFLNKFFAVWQGFWLGKPGIYSLRITLENFMLGYNASTPFYLCVDILIVIVFIIAIVKLKRNQTMPGMVFCLYLFLIPVIAAFVFSRVFFSVYLDRGLIIASPYFYLILAVGLAGLNRRFLRLAIPVVLFFLICTSLYGYYKNWMFTDTFHHTGVHLKKPIKPVAEFIEDNLEEGDLVVFTNQSVMPSFSFYSAEKIDYNFLFVHGDAYYPFSGKEIHEDRFRISVNSLEGLGFDRLWVISCNWPRDGNLDKNSKSVIEWLDSRFEQDLVREFDGLWVRRYAAL